MLSQRKSKARPVSRATRQAVARRVSDAFNQLPPDQKRKFTDDTLTVLVNMKKKQMGKLFGKFVKRGRPSTKDLETINQLVVVFLHSVKPEFRYHYASMIFKSLNLPLPKDLPQKLKDVRKHIFLSDIGISLEVYEQMFSRWEETGRPDYNTFFVNLLNAQKT